MEGEEEVELKWKADIEIGCCCPTAMESSTCGDRKAAEDADADAEDDDDVAVDMDVV